MFGNAHPRPPQRKEVAMQVVQQRQRAFDTTLAVDLPDGVAAAPPPAQAIRLDVACTLADYLSMLREHVAFVLRRAPPARRRRAIAVPLALGMAAAVAAWLAGPGWPGATLALAGVVALGSLPFAAGFWVLLLGTPLFLYKRHRMPRYAVRIDAHGIARSHCGTAGGAGATLVRSWDEVRMVRRYRRGYLLMFARGALPLPLPLRCMDQEQQRMLRRFALAHRSGAAAAATPPA
ncbi:hypothetical protein [uncultured Massilia sp.]|uniref:hypothetical protein n=1 Tax=uncultured Massilia sp. TaxID=169973 RepID=UPI0025F8EB9E|nr:hypothetical protein [uncultured Massilia sp.]